jgi:hypothetical protein
MSKLDELEAAVVKSLDNFVENEKQCAQVIEEFIAAWGRDLGCGIYPVTNGKYSLKVLPSDGEDKMSAIYPVFGNAVFDDQSGFWTVRVRLSLSASALVYPVGAKYVDTSVILDVGGIKSNYPSSGTKDFARLCRKPQ